MPGIPHIHLRGTPSRMGESFGEQCRDKIVAFTEIRLACAVAFAKDHYPEGTVSIDDVRRIAASMVEVHRNYSPAVWDEFEGISRGAGVPVADLIVTNGLTDLRDHLLPLRVRSCGADRHDGSHECTAIMVPASCARNGPLVGQTWDMHAEASDFIVVVHRRPDDRPATVGLTTTGCLCLIGLNEDGLAVGNTNLVPTDAGVGVNYLFTITESLACTSAEQVATVVRRTPRLSGHNFYAADRGQVVNLECTSGCMARTDVTDRPFLHTNHYLDPRLAPLELLRDISNSTWRLERIQAAFADAPMVPDLDWYWAKLRDVAQDCVPQGVEGVATVAGVLMQPEEGLLHVGAGAPDVTTAESLTVGCP